MVNSNSNIPCIIATILDVYLDRVSEYLQCTETVDA